MAGTLTWHNSLTMTKHYDTALKKTATLIS